MPTIQVGPYLLDSVTGKRLNAPTSKFSDPKLADYTRQQYLKYAGTGLFSGGGSKLRSTGMGITPTPVIPKVSTTSTPKATAVSKPSAGPSPFRQITDWMGKVGNMMQTPLPTPQAQVAPEPQFDWAGLLNKMMKPQGPDYLSMINALANPGKIADLATPDLHYIFERYNPTIRNVWQGLGSEIEGLRTAAVGRETASQDALKQSFAETAGDTKTAADKATSDLSELAARLNVSEGMLTTGAQQRTDQANRLAGIADILGKQDLASAQSLATARGANYDTMASMAKGSEARGLADLASLIAAGQAQAELNTQGYYSDAKLADAQGRRDLAQLYGTNMGRQQQNQMDMLKLWSQLKSDDDAAKAAAQQDNPYTETTTDTYEDQPFWDAINSLAAGDPAASALLAKTRDLAGGSLPEMQKLLAGISNPKPKINIGGFGGDWSTLGKPIINSSARREADAAKKLLQAYANYGGAYGKPQTKTTITYKSGK